MGPVSPTSLRSSRHHSTASKNRLMKHPQGHVGPYSPRLDDCTSTCYRPVWRIWHRPAWTMPPGTVQYCIAMPQLLGRRCGGPACIGWACAGLWRHYRSSLKQDSFHSGREANEINRGPTCVGSERCPLSKIRHACPWHY